MLKFLDSSELEVCRNKFGLFDLEILAELLSKRVISSSKLSVQTICNLSIFYITVYKKKACEESLLFLDFSPFAIIRKMRICYIIFRLCKKIYRCNNNTRRFTLIQILSVHSSFMVSTTER